MKANCTYCGLTFDSGETLTAEQYAAEGAALAARLQAHHEAEHANDLALLDAARKLVFSGLPERWELEDLGGWVYRLLEDAQERAPRFAADLADLRRALELWRLQELFLPNENDIAAQTLAAAEA